MFEKDMRLVLLLDYYGDLLGERRRNIMELYYCEDLSLAEIAENTGISRQAVRDSIKKSEAELRNIEASLHLAERLGSLRVRSRQHAEKLSSLLTDIPDEEGRQTVRNTIAFLMNLPI